MMTTQSSDVPTLNGTAVMVAVMVDPSLASLSLYQLSVSLWTFYYPALLVLGTAGNVMSILIMRSMRSAESTVNLFFIALAGGDLLVLYSGIVTKWINIAYGINVVDKWPAVFYPVFFLYLSAGGFVSWVLVCMTLQRALSVAWPHRVARVFTRGRVVKLIVAVAGFQVVLYVHHLYCVYVTSTTALTGSQCIGLPSFSYVWFLDNVFIYMAMVLTSVLPFLCLVIGNGVLVIALVTSVSQARKNISAGNPYLNDKRQKDTNSVTVTIIVISLTFIALTLPVFIYAAFFRFKDQSRMSAEKKAQVFLFYTVGSLLMSTNSSINFYLYCLTGRRFRQEFVKMLSCGTTTDVKI
ncbi:hypothetical protein ACOMHN_038304 [Nucella lapillus]